MISLPIHRTITLVKCTHPSLFSCTTTPEIRHCNCTFHCKRGRFVYWIRTLVPCPSVCLTVILKCTIKSQTARQTTKTHITHVLIPIGHSILLPHSEQFCSINYAKMFWWWFVSCGGDKPLNLLHCHQTPLIILLLMVGNCDISGSVG